MLISQCVVVLSLHSDTNEAPVAAHLVIAFTHFVSVGPRANASAHVLVCVNRTMTWMGCNVVT